MCIINLCLHVNILLLKIVYWKNHSATESFRSWWHMQPMMSNRRSKTSENPTELRDIRVTANCFMLFMFPFHIQFVNCYHKPGLGDTTGPLFS